MACMRDALSRHEKLTAFVAPTPHGPLRYPQLTAAEERLCNLLPRREVKSAAWEGSLRGARSERSLREALRSRGARSQPFGASRSRWVGG